MCVRIGGKSKREEHSIVTVAFIWPGSGRIHKASSQRYVRPTANRGVKAVGGGSRTGYKICHI